MTVAHMKLQSFRVTNFRSVRDSGWIDAGSVSALIGTNESGKTNLLVPLWKLNPAKEGEIKLLQDAPRKDFNNYRQMEDKPIFITALFDLSDSLADQVAKIAKLPASDVKKVEISRDFDGEYFVSFPDVVREVEKKKIEQTFALLLKEVKKVAAANDDDSSHKEVLIQALDAATKHLASKPDKVSNDTIQELETILNNALEGIPAKAPVAALYKQKAVKEVRSYSKEADNPAPAARV